MIASSVTFIDNRCAILDYPDGTTVTLTAVVGDDPWMVPGECEVFCEVQYLIYCRATYMEAEARGEYVCHIDIIGCGADITVAEIYLPVDEAAGTVAA